MCHTSPDREEIRLPFDVVVNVPYLDPELSPFYRWGGPPLVSTGGGESKFLLPPNLPFLFMETQEQPSNETVLIDLLLLLLRLSTNLETHDCNLI